MTVGQPAGAAVKLTRVRWTVSSSRTRERAGPAQARKRISDRAFRDRRDGPRGRLALAHPQADHDVDAYQLVSRRSRRQPREPDLPGRDVAYLAPALVEKVVVAGGVRVEEGSPADRDPAQDARGGELAERVVDR